MIGVVQPSGEHVSGARSVRVLALAAAIAISVFAIATPAAASRGGLSVDSMTVQSGPTEFWSGPTDFWSGPSA